MNNMLRYSICLSLGMFLSGQHFELPGEVTKVGTAAANWLKLDTGARGIAMGGAQTAAGTGMSGVPYNPANIAFLQDKSKEILISVMKLSNYSTLRTTVSDRLVGKFLFIAQNIYDEIPVLAMYFTFSRHII